MTKITTFAKLIIELNKLPRYQVGPDLQWVISYKNLLELLGRCELPTDPMTLARADRRFRQASETADEAIRHPMTPALQSDSSDAVIITGTFGQCCTNGDCCGPGSSCCANTGPHIHPELAYEALTLFQRGECAMTNNPYHVCALCDNGLTEWVDCALAELINLEFELWQASLDNPAQD